MKRWVLLPLVLLLTGCQAIGVGEQSAQALRDRYARAEQITFRAQITADYIDRLEEFTLDCRIDGDGVLSFTVAEPESIAGITGTVSGTDGSLVCDGQVLAFGLMADGRFSPVSAPWIAVRALKQGCLISACAEGELLHLTVDDSYADNALTVDLWTRDGLLTAAEISHQGRRVVSMTVGQCNLLSDPA